MEAEREAAQQAHHYAATGERLLADYAAQERGGPRVIRDADDWLTVVPFWAAWPFETLLVPMRPAARLADLDGHARNGLAAALPGPQPPLRRAVPAAVPVLDGLAPGAVPASGDRSPGRSTRTSIRRSCARRCASSWSATSCSASRSAT